MLISSSIEAADFFGESAGKIEVENCDLEEFSLKKKVILMSGFILVLLFF